MNVLRQKSSQSPVRDNAGTANQLRKRKRFLSLTGQSIIEYVLLFMIVAAAITVTHKYVYRSMNARLKQIQDELENK